MVMGRSSGPPEPDGRGDGLSRRRVLAGATALLTSPLAGCGHPPVVLDMDEASDASIADQVSTAAEPGSEEYRVLASARENGTATRRGRSELFDRRRAVRLDGAVYEVAETRVDSYDETVYTVELDVDPADPEPRLGAIPREKLPAADRERLDPLLSREAPPEQEGVDFGVSYGSVAEVGESAFVPEPQYDIIVDGDRRIRVAVESRTVSAGEYRYELTEVALTVAAFADQLRADSRFELTGLSEAERAVVETAIESGYFEDDDAFRSVVERIRAHEGLEVTDTYGTWLLAYEGVEYLTYVEW